MTDSFAPFKTFYDVFVCDSGLLDSGTTRGNCMDEVKPCSLDVSFWMGDLDRCKANKGICGRINGINLFHGIRL